MRRYQKWLSVGLIALTPGVTLAGPLDSPQQQSTSSAAAAAKPAQKAKGNTNQDIANRIKASLLKAKLHTFDIEISVDKGVATLDGAVGSPEQRKAAHKAAMVAGVDKVNNRLRVNDPTASRGPVQQAAAVRRPMAGPQNVRPVNFQDGPDGQPPIQQGMIPQAMPPQGKCTNAPARNAPARMPPQGMPPQAMGPMGGPLLRECPATVSSGAQPCHVQSA